MRGKSINPKDRRRARIGDIMSELTELFWEIYELDGEDKEFNFQYILQTSKIQPKRLTVQVLNDLEYKDFRELIKEKILERELNIKTAADLLGIARPTLSNFLNHKADLSVELALKIQKEFEIDAEAMLRMELKKNIDFIRVTTFQPRAF